MFALHRKKSYRQEKEGEIHAIPVIAYNERKRLKDEDEN